MAPRPAAHGCAATLRTLRPHSLNVIEGTAQRLLGDRAIGPGRRAAPDWLIKIHPVRSVAPDNAGICHPLTGSPEYWLSQFSTVTNSVITAPAMTAVIFGSGRRWGSRGMLIRGE